MLRYNIIATVNKLCKQRTVCDKPGRILFFCFKECGVASQMRTMIVPCEIDSDQLTLHISVHEGKHR